CLGLVRRTVSISSGAQGASLLSTTLKHIRTWKVQALSPVVPPKSQLGSSSEHLSSRRGSPRGSGSGGGSVRHSCQQSVSAFAPPGTYDASSSSHVGEQASPAVML